MQKSACSMGWFMGTISLPLRVSVNYLVFGGFSRGGFFRVKFTF